MALDSHSTAFLESLAASGARPFHQMRVEEARQFMGSLRDLIGPGPTMASVRNEFLPCDTGSFRVRVLTPSAAPRGIIVYCHGGGWALMSVDDYDTLGRRLAVATQCTVILVDYRLAPEHPFPAGLEDAWTAIRWADGNREVLASSRRAPLFIAGDSAGGNLAAVIAQRARGVVDLAQQVLIYPVTSADLDAECYGAAHNQGLLGGLDMQWFWNLYLPDIVSRRNPEAAPILSSDLRGLPAAIVVTAECDILREEGEAYASALRSAGVPVDHRCFEGQMHGFFSMGQLLPASVDAMEFVALSIRRTLDELTSAPV